jgi:hypothetical protein
LFPATPVFSKDRDWLYVSNLALDIRLFGLAQSDVSQWVAKTKRYTVSKIRARIPPLRDPGLSGPAADTPDRRDRGVADRRTAARQDGVAGGVLAEGGGRVALALRPRPARAPEDVLAGCAVAGRREARLGCRAVRQRTSTVPHEMLHGPRPGALVWRWSDLHVAAWP